jgi:hypothetical protein
MEVAGLSEMLVATNKIIWHYFLKNMLWWVAQYMNLVAPLLTAVWCVWRLLCSVCRHEASILV